MIIVLVLVLPVAVLISGGVATALHGTLLRRDVEQEHEGSELLEIW